MPNIINEAFPSTYLKASDLQGREIAVTIERVEFEAVGREREQKAIVYFVGKTKGVVLNKTNAKKIVEIAGSALTEDWYGTTIILFPTETEFGGETVDCIRVKAPARAATMVRRPAPAIVAPPAPPIVRSNGAQHAANHDAITVDDIPF
jgi:hypothetical protein